MQQVLSMFFNSLLVLAALAPSVPASSSPTSKPPIVPPLAQAVKPPAKAFPKMESPATPVTTAQPFRAIGAPRTMSRVASVRHPALAPRVDFDVDANGLVWARGERWKASFGPQATTFIPFFGSSAPKNYPVTLRIASVTSGDRPIAFDAAAAALRNGDRIRFDRG